MRTRYLGGVTGVSAAAILGAACGAVLAQSIAELMAIIRTQQRQIEALSRRPSLRLDRKGRPRADYPQLAVERVLSGASLIPGAEALDSHARRRRLHGWCQIALREARRPLLTLLAIKNTARLRPRCFRLREGNLKL